MENSHEVDGLKRVDADDLRSESAVIDLSTRMAAGHQRLEDMVANARKSDPSIDPVLTEDDKLLIAKTKTSLSTLKIEIQTIVGFVSDHFVSKYNIKDQEQFDRVVGSL